MSCSGYGCNNLTPCRACAAMARLMKERDEAQATVASLARIMGWMNVPPREVLERDLNCKREVLQQAEAERDDARAEAATLRAALDVATEDLRAARKAQAHWSDLASDYLRQLTEMRDQLATARARGETLPPSQTAEVRRLATGEPLDAESLRRVLGEDGPVIHVVPRETKR